MCDVSEFKEKNELIKIVCLFCKKEVKVKLISYGSGHIATCPECGELAYNGE